MGLTSFTTSFGWHGHATASSRSLRLSVSVSVNVCLSIVKVCLSIAELHRIDPPRISIPDRRTTSRSTIPNRLWPRTTLAEPGSRGCNRSRHVSLPVRTDFGRTRLPPAKVGPRTSGRQLYASESTMPLIRGTRGTLHTMEPTRPGGMVLWVPEHKLGVEHKRLTAPKGHEWSRAYPCRPPDFGNGHSGKFTPIGSRRGQATDTSRQRKQAYACPKHPTFFLDSNPGPPAPPISAFVPVGQRRNFDEGFGLTTMLGLPAAGEIMLYQPMHPEIYSL